MNSCPLCTVLHIRSRCTSANRMAVLRIEVKSTKTKWDIRTEKFKARTPCSSKDRFLIHGAVSDICYIFYRYIKTDIHIPIQKISIVVRYNYWLQILCHSTVEIFKVKELDGDEQATSLNIDPAMCCTKSRFKRAMFSRPHPFYGHQMFFIKSNVNWCTRSKICGDGNCIIFAR